MLLHICNQTYGSEVYHNGVITAGEMCSKHFLLLVSERHLNPLQTIYNNQPYVLN